MGIVHDQKEKVIYPELSYEIVGLFFKMHQALGMYRNEKQYGDYFESLLRQAGKKYMREYRFVDPMYTTNQQVRCIVDFIIENKMIIEFKAKDFITKEDYYQVKRYLVTLNLHLALLVNFRQKRLVPKRVLNSLYYKS